MEILYKAFDGELFETEEECEKYEKDSERIYQKYGVVTDIIKDKFLELKFFDDKTKHINFILHEFNKILTIEATSTIVNKYGVEEVTFLFNANLDSNKLTLGDFKNIISLNKKRLTKHIKKFAKSLKKAFDGVK